MKKSANILVGSLVGIALVISGVSMKAQSAAAQRPAVQPAGAYQRFVPMPRQPADLTGVPWSGAFALDTKTGLLCRTYETGDEYWSNIASCLDLYRKY